MRWIASVEDDSRAATVEENTWDLHDRSAVCQSPERDLDTCVSKSLVEIIELGFLLMRISLINTIGSRHMREHTENLQIRKSGDPANIGNREIRVVSQIADPAHARIDCKQAVNSFVHGCCCIVDSLGIVRIVNDRRYVILGKSVCIHIRSQAENDYSFLCACVPQSDSFVQRCDSKGFDSVVAQYLSALNGAVTVSIGFDDADELSALGCAHLSLDLLYIVLEIAEIDFSPSRSDCFFIHDCTFFLYYTFTVLLTKCNLRGRIGRSWPFCVVMAGSRLPISKACAG